QHFFLSVSLPDGGRRIVAREAAAAERQARIHHGKMQWMSDKDIDQHRAAAYAEAFANTAHDAFRSEAMQEQEAAYKVETRGKEGKAASIGNYRTIPIHRR